MTAPVYVVQFPHPGGEHRPRGPVMPWNRGPHARKFMLAQGKYVADTEAERSGKVVFWGEWEGPSRVLRRWPKDGEFPRCLHEPFLDEPPSGDRQNTDPWVFGDSFHYSNCKQRTNGGTTATSMQRLTPGSVILFGSSLSHEFVLDTLFVVGERRETWVAAEDVELDIDPSFRIATIESISSRTKYSEASFTLYWGAGPGNPVAEMFSFVPCIPFDGEGPRFARPTLNLPGFINPRSRQSTLGSKNPRSVGEARAAWQSVVDQVSRQDLLLATRLDLSGTDGDL